MRVHLFLQNKTTTVLSKDMSEALEQQQTTPKDISEAQ